VGTLWALLKINTIFVVQYLNTHDMATSYYIKAGKQTNSPVFIRFRSRVNNIDIRLKTDIEVDSKNWERAHEADAPQSRLKGYKAVGEGKKAYDLLNEIDKSLAAYVEINGTLPSEEAKRMIYAVTHKEEIIEAEKRKAELKQIEEDRRRIEEEAGRMTLSKYIDLYIAGIEQRPTLTIDGITYQVKARCKKDGLRYERNTIIAIKQPINKLRQFEQKQGRKYDFKDINLDFHADFTHFLQSEGYSINSIGKAFKVLKSVLSSAESEGYDTGNIYRNNKFTATRVDVDNIALTQEELDKINSVDLSDLPPCYEIARDIFMIGVYTAQRVSDYNHLSKTNICSYHNKPCLRIRQKKTGADVIIPIYPELQAILDKYNDVIPHLWEQHINNYLKVIAERAGLTDIVTIRSTKGGKEQIEDIPKYKLIHTHTARRTGATLMYKAGWNKFDIMAITGHTTTTMLDKYIKSNDIDRAFKLLGIEDINYFSQRWK